MSDDAYSKFLDQANQDASGGGNATTQSSQKKFSTKSVNTAVPASLEGVEEYYVSDADEPFEAVALAWDGDGKLGADKLKKLLGHDNEVSEIGEKEFDPRGQYKNIITKVKQAGNGKVSVFRVESGGTRVEYFVVSVDEKEGRVVGLKALAVES